MTLHVHEGGTGVTNFPIEQQKIYQKAIDEYGDKALTISFDIMVPQYNVVGEVMCLHDASGLKRRDLSEFWSIFDRLCGEGGRP